MKIKWWTKEKRRTKGRRCCQLREQNSHNLNLQKQEQRQFENVCWVKVMGWDWEAAGVSSEMRVRGHFSSSGLFWSWSELVLNNSAPKWTAVGSAGCFQAVWSACVVGSLLRVSCVWKQTKPGTMGLSQSRGELSFSVLCSVCHVLLLMRQDQQKLRLQKRLKTCECIYTFSKVLYRKVNKKDSTPFSVYITVKYLKSLKLLCLQRIYMHFSIHSHASCCLHYSGQSKNSNYNKSILD